MNSSLYKKQQIKYICSLLRCTKAELEEITENIDSYYSEWSEEKINVITREPKKHRDGTIKTRTFRPSHARLKTIQKQIKVKVLDPISLPINIHGGVKKKSNITNAKYHQGNKFIFTTDLMNFYPTITNAMVVKMFKSLGFSNYAAYYLTKLTTWMGSLPQGAPTSKHIADIVFLNIDKEIIDFCNNYSIKYTRFVDDITLSSQQDFQPLIKQLMAKITSQGFNINYRKTSYSGKQKITGIAVFNNYIDAPDEIKAKAKAKQMDGDQRNPFLEYAERIRKTNMNATTKKLRKEKP